MGSYLELPNIPTNNVSNLDIDQAIHKKLEKDLKSKMPSLSKLKDNVFESFERKAYIENKNVLEARAMFKFRTKMFNCKMNYKNDSKFKRDLWRCDSCQREVDTQTHVLSCPAYRSLREDKDMNNFEDLAKYLAQVLKIREHFGFSR